MTSTKTAPPVTETEEQLIETAQQALSHCRWVVGECAVKWTKRYAKGRTDADFGNLIGLTADQVYQRRRVFETFGDVHADYPQLAWSHFYAALTWDDAAECLQWADETGSTVAEMKAWRRAAHGEDLSEPAEEEFPEFVQALSPETAVVQDPSGYGEGRGRGEKSRGARESDEARLAGVARGTDEEDYAPFRDGATKPVAPEKAATAVEDLSAEQLAKRLCTTLERCTKAITPDFVRQLPKLPEKVRQRLHAAVADLTTRMKELK